MGIIIYNLFYNINNIPKGQFLEEFKSPNKEYSVRAYLITNSLSADSLRVELVDNNTKKVKNVYYNYPADNVEIEWINNEIIRINEIELNVLKDSYDWRKN